MRKTSQHLLSYGSGTFRKVCIPIIKLEDCLDLSLQLAKAIAYSTVRPVCNRDSFIWNVYKSTSHRKDIEYIALLVMGTELKTVDQILAIDFGSILGYSSKYYGSDFIKMVIKEIKLLSL